MKILFRDGVNLRFFEDRSKIPDKHQLLLEFKDKEILIAFVQMYGGVGCFIVATENTAWSEAIA